MAHCHNQQAVSGKCYASYITLFKYIKDARTLDTKCKMQCYFTCRSYKITPSKTVLQKQDLLKTHSWQVTMFKIAITTIFFIIQLKKGVYHKQGMRFKYDIVL